MKFLILSAAAGLLSVAVFGQKQSKEKFKPAVSIGTRNTLSFFNSDAGTGKGIGGQTRVQLGKRLNTEWYLDYITSKTNLTHRNDMHVGWSLMFYLKENYDFSRLLQPYLIAGHCFDNTQVFERANKNNNATRLSMATQAGIGMHVNITPKFDCSLTSQYMLHFGKDIATSVENNKVVIEKEKGSHVDGHLLVAVSFNYKIAGLKHK